MSLGLRTSCDLDRALTNYKIAELTGISLQEQFKYVEKIFDCMTPPPLVCPYPPLFSHSPHVHMHPLVVSVEFSLVSLPILHKHQ
jgi:hypothetical protein